MRKVFGFLLVVASTVVNAPYGHSDELAVPLELMLFEPMVEVASQEAEPLKEAPVITNVVTDTEIRRMGARTLEDILLTIPGFSHIQDHNEYFGAERGIYASAQQKILILRDGHRLNSRSYSEANFDYSISLDNVKRIEILRGPGGSLYGDVALTAVINLVTKDAKDLDGVEVFGGYGNYQQTKAGLVAGKDLGNLGSFLISGTLFKADGQVRNWEDPRTGVTGDSVVYGFRDLPAYDTYLKYRLGDWGVSASRRYGHYIEPRSGSGLTGQIYDIHKTVKFAEETPGLSSAFDHYEVGYTPQLGDWKLATKLYYDGFQLRANLVINPAAGSQGNLLWKDYTGGGQVQASRPYELLGKGTLLVGAQFEQMEVYESTFEAGVPPAILPAAPALKTGKERGYAGFAQVKHRILEQLIANLGLRYDYKERRPDTDVVNVDQLSPRAALVYLMAPELNFRLSYGRSFVDAPYWYRYNTLASYQGARTLKPEKMNTVQFSIESLLAKVLEHRLNVYYNDMSDVVFRNLAGSYTNAGIIKSGGLEYEMGYRQEMLNARANYTYQRFYEVSGYSAQDFKMENVPTHMANLIVDVAPVRFLESDWAKNLWLNLTVRYTGQQYARWGKGLASPKTVVDDALICNLGLTEEIPLGSKNHALAIGVHAYNLLDRQVYQGGSVEYPFLQEGRWILGQITYAFKP